MENIMMKVYRYRLYPTKAEKTILNNSLELFRWIYNETLVLRKNVWESEQKIVNYYDSKKRSPIWKYYKPQLKNVHSQVLRGVVKRVYFEFQIFLRSVKAGENLVILDLKDMEDMTVSGIINLILN